MPSWVWVVLLVQVAVSVPLQSVNSEMPSFLELATKWSGWSPKMTASFDIETHAWKPPWFRDGVEGVYVEPFPSYLWLKNGMAIPLTDADKYIFTKDEATQAEDEQKLSKPGEPLDEENEHEKNDKNEKELPEDEEDIPEVDGVPVPRAKEQLEQMKKFNIDPKLYVPGSLVGQKVFNEWWNSIHTKENGPSAVADMKDEVKSWFFPHLRQHMREVKDNWLDYFGKVLGMQNEANPEVVHAPAQNTEQADDARRKFFYKRMPDGECFNIGTGVVCTPLLRDRDLPNHHQIDAVDPMAEKAIADAISSSSQVRSTMGMRTETHEAFDKTMREKEFNSRKLMLMKRKGRRKKLSAKTK
eukprot:c27424_g1_i1.p1 GENE.c27424_g1_i1~~c27424_g1_i1.p1  ORF type:complete len:356 (-),score=65.69 c27424_g1_i1:61-1128(-)